MMSSGTSTKPGQVFVLLSMAAATAAVMVTTNTHPAALLVMSGGILACGLAAYFFHTALYSMVGPKRAPAAVTGQRRETLAADKNRILHTIKELEFDHRMGKVNAKDFDALAAPLRRKAAMLIEELDRIDETNVDQSGALGDQSALPAPGARPEPQGRVCAACGVPSEADARFCKGCGAKL
jgi:hypothetical protein